MPKKVITTQPEQEIDITDPDYNERVQKYFDQFKKLCEMQCTLQEIAGFFDCSEDTIERWCKRELEEPFAEAFKKYSAKGKSIPAVIERIKNCGKASERNRRVADAIRRLTSAGRCVKAAPI